MNHCYTVAFLEQGHLTSALLNPAYTISEDMSHNRFTKHKPPRQSSAAERVFKVKTFLSYHVNIF